MSARAKIFSTAKSFLGTLKSTPLPLPTKFEVFLSRSTISTTSMDKAVPRAPLLARPGMVLVFVLMKLSVISTVRPGNANDSKKPDTA